MDHIYDPMNLPDTLLDLHDISEGTTVVIMITMIRFVGTCRRCIHLIVRRLTVPQCCQQIFVQTAAQVPLEPRRQIKAHRQPRRTRFSSFFVGQNRVNGSCGVGNTVSSGLVIIATVHDTHDG